MAPWQHIIWWPFFAYCYFIIGRWIVKWFLRSYIRSLPASEQERLANMEGAEVATTIGNKITDAARRHPNRFTYWLDQQFWGYMGGGGYRIKRDPTQPNPNWTDRVGRIPERGASSVSSATGATTSSATNVYGEYR